MEVMVRSGLPDSQDADGRRWRGSDAHAIRARSRSPRIKDSHSHRRHRHREDEDIRRGHSKRGSQGNISSGSKGPVELPHSARQLSKNDFRIFRPLFAYYLDLQKQKYIEEMDEREVKGRWKSFLGKWNRGELAEGWYDPEMFSRITSDAQEEAPEPRAELVEPPSTEDRELEREMDSDSDDDGYGPTLAGSSSGREARAAAPTLQDLSLRDELNAESNSAAREASIAALRQARKLDRKDQKEKLDDLLPRAEAGTRERQLEKRKLVNDKMREFRDKSPGMDGADDKELIGGGDDLAAYKRMKEQEKRWKSEREVRKEQIQRAKVEEMEEKKRAWKEREEGTVSMLRELAKQRFG